MALSHILLSVVPNLDWGGNPVDSPPVRLGGYLHKTVE